MMRAILLGLCVALLASYDARADATLVGYAGDPNGCFVSIKREPAEGMLHVYPFGRTSSRDCDVTFAMLAGAIEEALKHSATSREPQPLRLIFLGRVADYPWMSRALTDWARNSLDWDPVKGHATAGRLSDNAVVADLISQMVVSSMSAGRDDLALLPALLERYGYRFSGASVEKVFAGVNGHPSVPSDVSNPQILPYDALLHLRIEKVQ